MAESVLEDSLTAVQDRWEGTRVERRQQLGGDRGSVGERRYPFEIQCVGRQR